MNGMAEKDRTSEAGAAEQAAAHAAHRRQPGGDGGDAVQAHLLQPGLPQVHGERGRPDGGPAGAAVLREHRQGHAARVRHPPLREGPRATSGAGSTRSGRRSRTTTKRFAEPGHVARDHPGVNVSGRGHAGRARQAAWSCTSRSSWTRATGTTWPRATSRRRSTSGRQWVVPHVPRPERDQHHERAAAAQDARQRGAGGLPAPHLLEAAQGQQPDPEEGAGGARAHHL